MSVCLFDRQGRAATGKKDMVFRTWDLNFGAWIFTLVVFQD
jgi:hypothetical protein